MWITHPDPQSPLSADQYCQDHAPDQPRTAPDVAAPRRRRAASAPHRGVDPRRDPRGSPAARRPTALHAGAGRTPDGRAGVGGRRLRRTLLVRIRERPRRFRHADRTGRRRGGPRPRRLAHDHPNLGAGVLRRPREAGGALGSHSGSPRSRPDLHRRLAPGVAVGRRRGRDVGPPRAPAHTRSCDGLSRRIYAAPGGSPRAPTNW